MKLTDSECKITGARVADIRIDTKTGDPVMEAIGVYIIAVNELNGARVTKYPCPPNTKILPSGSLTAYHQFWSAATLEKLNNLIESMESDLIQLLFKEDKHGRNTQARTETDGDDQTPPTLS